MVVSCWAGTSQGSTIPAIGQGAMGRNWSMGSSVWTWGRTSSLWGWWSTGKGCPGRLWSLLLWRYSRPAWTRSCAACCRWPCFGRRVGLDDPQRSFPTPTILWFCDSVIPGDRQHVTQPEHQWHDALANGPGHADTQIFFPGKRIPCWCCRPLPTRPLPRKAVV